MKKIKTIISLLGIAYLSISTAFSMQKIISHEMIVVSATQELAKRYKEGLLSYLEKTTQQYQRKKDFFLEFRHVEKNEQIFVPLSPLSFENFLLFSALNGGFKWEGTKMVSNPLPYIASIDGLDYDPRRYNLFSNKMTNSSIFCDDRFNWFSAGRTMHPEKGINLPFYTSTYEDYIVFIQGEKGVKVHTDLNENIYLKSYISPYSFIIFKEGKIFEDLKISIELEKENEFVGKQEIL